MQSPFLFCALVTMATPEETIQANFEGPKRVTSDGQTVEQYPLADQIAAAEFLGGQAANGSSKLPVKIRNMRPGGPLGGPNV